MTVKTDCACVTTVEERWNACTPAGKCLLLNEPDAAALIEVRVYADEACPRCGGTGTIADVAVDWKLIVMQLLDCFEEREGWTYEADWCDYGITRGQESAILIAHKQHKLTKD